MNALGRLLRAIVLVGLGIGLALGMAEGFLRLRPKYTTEEFLIEPHPFFGWAHIPGKKGIWRASEFRTKIEINSKGLRDKEYPYAKPPGTYRILVLGDSFVEAVQVPLQDCFSEVLERTLNEQAKKAKLYEVINAGVLGYGTDQELLFFRQEGVHYDPDLVLLCFWIVNDASDNSYVLRGGMSKPYFILEGEELKLHNFPVKGPGKLKDPGRARDLKAEAEGPVRSSEILGMVKGFLVVHSQLYLLVGNHLPRVLPPVAKALMRVGLMSEKGEPSEAWYEKRIQAWYAAYAQPPSPAWEEAWKITLALIAQMHTEIRGQGRELVVVILPGVEQVYPEAWRRSLERYPPMNQRKWDLEKPNRILTTHMDTRGIPYIDLLPLFREYAERRAKDRLFYSRDVHFTRAGHRLVAETLYQYLSDGDAVKWERSL